MNPVYGTNSDLFFYAALGSLRAYNCPEVIGKLAIRSATIRYTTEWLPCVRYQTTE